MGRPNTERGIPPAAAPNRVGRCRGSSGSLAPDDMLSAGGEARGETLSSTELCTANRSGFRISRSNSSRAKLLLLVTNRRRGASSACA